MALSYYLIRILLLSLPLTVNLIVAKVLITLKLQQYKKERKLVCKSNIQVVSVKVVDQQLSESKHGATPISQLLILNTVEK